MVAAIDGQKEELTRLIESGADVNTKLEDGKISNWLSICNIQCYKQWSNWKSALWAKLFYTLFWRYSGIISCNFAIVGYS